MMGCIYPLSIHYLQLHSINISLSTLERQNSHSLHFAHMSFFFSYLMFVSCFKPSWLDRMSSVSFLTALILFSILS
jgi:hypothetical protein